jgi:co-chaperonin GroES (HSP10)|tara:strand:+ start:305 stop:562 length:258 start_codon:yes stop_codon:yes gene_type:complete
MKPIGKNIIIQPIDEEIKTQSGLLLSSEDTNQLRYKKGIVVIQGTDVTVINSDDTIYYDKRAGFTMLINNEPFTIIQEKDVVVVV